MTYQATAFGRRIGPSDGDMERESSICASRRRARIFVLTTREPMQPERHFTSQEPS
jgi:hypothetical protein